jgi:hypothetical protein
MPIGDACNHTHFFSRLNIMPLIVFLYHFKSIVICFRFVFVFCTNLTLKNVRIGEQWGQQRWAVKFKLNLHYTAPESFFKSENNRKLMLYKKHFIWLADENGHRDNRRSQPKLNESPSLSRRLSWYFGNDIFSHLKEISDKGHEISARLCKLLRIPHIYFIFCILHFLILDNQKSG